MSCVFVLDVVRVEEVAQLVFVQAVTAFDLLLEQGGTQLVCLVICHILFADLLIIKY